MSDLTVTIYTGLASLHVQHERWDEALAILQEGVEQSTTTLARSHLLLRLCDVHLARGDYQAAGAQITTLEAMMADIDDHLIRSAIHARKADMLAQSGQVDAAADEYDRAIAQLDGRNEQATVAALYAAKHSQLLRRGSNIAAAFDEQDRRIDLAYDGLHSLTRARLLEQEGLANIAENKALDALQAYNQAIEIYEQYGSRVDQQRLYARRAQLFERTGVRDAALVLYSRLGDTEAVERICALRASQVAALEGLDEVLSRLTVVQTDEAQIGRVSALGALAQVIPDAALPPIVDDLVSFLSGRDSMDRNVSIRRASARAIQALAPRIPLAQLTELLDALIAVTEPDTQSRGATIAEAAKAIGRLLVYHHQHIPQHRQVQIVTRLLDIARETPEPLGHEAFEAAITIALNAGGMSRDVVVDYLGEHDAEPVAVAYLSALEVKLTPQQLQSTVAGLLAGLGASATSIDGGVRVTYGAYVPRVFENMKAQLSPEQVHSIVQSFIQGVENQHDTLGSRGQLLYVLGQLADRMSDSDVSACATLCQTVVERGIPVSAHLAMMQQTAGNPFSNVHMISGTKANVFGGAAWAIAHLFERLRGTQRFAAISTLRQLAKDRDPEVRQSVAGSMHALRGLRQAEHRQLVLPLIVLLHDADATVRGLAIRSAADLYNHNAVAANMDIAERILDLGLDDPELTVRTAVAYALKHYPFNAISTLTALVAQVRDKLEADPSFQVRSLLPEVATTVD